MTLLRLLVLVVLLPVFGCGHAKNREYAKITFNDQTEAILSGATKVEVFRTDGENGPSGPSGPKPKVAGEARIGGFLITARGNYQGPDFAAKLAGILHDIETGHTRKAVTCFWPGIAFRVWKDEEAVEVLICFKCRNFYCGPPTERGYPMGSFSEPPSVRTRLIQLAKETFPDDKEIQGLEE
jgi:hypothetical protein